MTIRKRNPTLREVNDFYRTPPKPTHALLQVEPLIGPLWEPCCGDGWLAREIKLYYPEVRCSDLIDRGYGDVCDFMATDEPWTGTIITNPPYSIVGDFVRHALAKGPQKLILLLRMAFKAGERRRDGLFRDHPPNHEWVCSARPTLWHGTAEGRRTSGGATDYSWFVWDRDRDGQPKTWDWLPTPVGIEAAIGEWRAAQYELQEALQGAARSRNACRTEDL